MSTKKLTHDLPIAIVLVFLALAFVLDGAEFLWWKLPASVQGGLRWLAAWIALNKPALYMVLAVPLLLTLFAGAVVIWKRLAQRG
jgi:hypothetical protein